MNEPVSGWPLSRSYTTSSSSALAEVLRHAPHHLPVGQHRVDDPAEVVDRPEAHHRHEPGLGGAPASAAWQALGMVIASRS
jgi:hypothetical protein